MAEIQRSIRTLYFQIRNRIVKLIRGTNINDNRIKKIYNTEKYLKAYSHHTDLRVKLDPKSAIGGKWKEIGQLQFDFLISKGLLPNHTVLDIGCGTLRGGRHLIKYLNTANYYGMDISHQAIKYSKKLVQQENLSEKDPFLCVNKEMNLKFHEFSEQTFDYILAQSVFTHLKPEDIEECFENIDDIMHKSSAFYFTYDKAEEYKQLSVKDFQYPYSFFKSLAEKYGFALHDCSNEYPHPRGQQMIELLKA
ncbi:MAG: class I SAM-dependent methyltransferase [Bacteroidota bacterium]|nr:class I SAM-dependent methyltransferase [Bacteroidota bacterium]